MCIRDSGERRIKEHDRNQAKRCEKRTPAIFVPNPHFARNSFHHTPKGPPPQYSAVGCFELWVWSGTIEYDDEQSIDMTGSQIDRIRKAEEAVRELVTLAAQIRQEADKLPIEDAALRKELLETAKGFEKQAQDLSNALREWREDIH